MNNKHNVLIFPAGSEIGLEIYNSLKYSHHVEIFAASGKNDHASFIYDDEHYYEGELYINQPDFIKRFNYILKKFKIDYIYPTHDSIAYFLSDRNNELFAKVLTSCSETNRIARYKDLTYEHFKLFDFCPEVFLTPFNNLKFPVFLKPNNGQGGKGTHVAENQNDLLFYLEKYPKLLVTEYLEGEELSVDCFTDSHGELLFIGPRTRERVQMGISFRSTMVEKTEEIKQIALSINSELSFTGAWFFQIKKASNGRFKLLEFAPRQSSTMGLYRHSGVNFALLSLFNALGEPVEIMTNSYSVQLDRCLYNRYKSDLNYQRVYIDFDETIVINNFVHDRVIAFLYQCRNRNIDLILLTKHRFNIYKTLRNCCISEYLFKEIIHITDTQDKWRYIIPEAAIFIDNYWYDRKEVSSKLGIPVFDVDVIECLLT